MTNLNTTLRSALALFLSSLGSLVCFGLILSLFWSLDGNDLTYKGITSLISASLSIIMGGFILAWMTKHKNHVLPAFLGLIIGFISSTYILGFSILVFPFTLIAVALSTVGSYLIK